MHIWWLLLLFVICQLSTVQSGYAALSCPTQTAVCHFTLCSESRLIADGMLHTLHQQRQQQKLIKNHKLLSDREFDRIRNVIRCDRSHEKKNWRCRWNGTPVEVAMNPVCESQTMANTGNTEREQKFTIISFIHLFRSTFCAFLFQQFFEQKNRR